MQKYTKWIHAGQEDSIAQVAVRALRSRLEPVQDYVVLAANKSNENTEYVHQMRVWSRRAMAAIRVFRPWLPKRRRRWIQDQLNWIRHASNDARDHDVFAMRLATDQDDPRAARLIERVCDLRRRAQQPIVAVYQLLVENGKLKRRSAQLLDRVRSRKRTDPLDKLTFERWAVQRIGALSGKFFSASDAGLSEVAALHRLRIRGKRLRYAIELLASAFPDGFRAQVYPMIQDVQDRLGEINDHATAGQRLGHWIDQAESPKERSYLQDMLESERAELDAQRRGFLQWWEGCQERKLRKAFAKVAARH